MYVQCLPDLTNSVLTNHPGLTSWFLTAKNFLLHKNFGFSEFRDLTNNSPGPDRFVKSGRHCTMRMHGGGGLGGGGGGSIFIELAA